VMGVECVIMSHPVSGAAHYLAGNINAAVINAGDGMHEHPTQGLLDMFTILDKKGSAGRAEGGDCRRYSPQQGGPLQHLGIAENGGRSGGRRPANADAARILRLSG
jgi:hypothetical protein